MKKTYINLISVLVYSFTVVVYASESLTKLPLKQTDQNNLVKVTSNKVMDEVDLPPVPLEKTPMLSSSPEVYVQEIQIKGNTVLSASVLESEIQPYSGRKIRHQELEQLRQKISKIYLKSGYINSGVIIPDQKVDDGIIILKVIEGRLSDVEVSGVHKLNPGFIQERLMSTDNEILKLTDLEEKLQLLKRDVRINNIGTRLMPSERRGEATLFVNVEEKTPYQLSLIANNHRSPSMGALRGEVEAVHRNLTGWGDEINLHLGLAEGLNDYSINYSRPWNRGRYETGISYNRSDANIVEAPFDLVDIESKSTSVSLQIRYWAMKRLHKTTQFSFHLDRRESKTSLAGKPFSFSPGVEEGISRVVVFRMIGEISRSSDKLFIALRSTMNMGIDALDATSNNNLPDGSFVSWNGQLRLSRKIFDHQLALRTDVQIAGDSLLPLEKFAIGGHGTVRGYRENLISRDSGWITSLEYRIPVSLKVFRSSRGNLFGFYDHGKGFDKLSSQQDLDSINSLGLGIQWKPTRKLFTEFAYAYAFKQVPDNMDSIQDKGVHFRMSYNFF